MHSHHCCADTENCGIQCALDTVLTMIGKLKEDFSLKHNSNIIGSIVTKPKGIPKVKKGYPNVNPKFYCLYSVILFRLY